MDTPEPEASIRAVIGACRRSKLAQLVESAAARHGYDFDGAGLNYPGDLDDYDREVDGAFIPEGFVEVYGPWMPARDHGAIVPESDYLRTLAKVLSESGLNGEAARVRSLPAYRDQM